ncbi:MAG: DNA polymerase III subunit gamma/tau, partial [Geopsychrobacter sp.]|nr:DNA polymerase III subunit gamma/tau [Geopsychrobacter sp.]
MGSVLEHAHPQCLELPHLKIGYPEGSFNLQLLGDAETRKSLESLASEFFDQPVKLEVVQLRKEQAATPTFAQQQQQQQVSRQQQLRDHATDHPMVKAAQNIFEAEVEEVRPIDKGFV